MQTREIILDTETTGLTPRDGHRIVEIGCLEMVNKVITGKKFHQYINPQRDMPEDAYRVHGISEDFLKNKPLFKDIAKDFLDFIKGAKLVIHNAPFDIRFLNYELSLIKFSSLDISDAIDTLTMARKMFPGAKASLDALCKRFKVDNSSRKFHGALKDALLLSEVYVELTGGRQKKFGVSDEKKYMHKIKIKENKNISGNGIVIYPNDFEKKMHEKFLMKIVNNC